jgi:hypothetical protein
MSSLSYIHLKIPTDYLGFPEILATHLDESWTHHFQLGITKVFKFQIIILVGLFRNVFWTPQNTLLRVSLGCTAKITCYLIATCIPGMHCKNYWLPDCYVYPWDALQKLPVV